VSIVCEKLRRADKRQFPPAMKSPGDRARRFFLLQSPFPSILVVGIKHKVMSQITTKMRISRYIPSDTLRDRIRNEDIRDIREIENPKKWKTRYLQASWTASEILMQKSDINITEKQIHWIKYSKKEKKKKNASVGTGSLSSYVFFVIITRPVFPFFVLAFDRHVDRRKVQDNCSLQIPRRETKGNTRKERRRNVESSIVAFPSFSMLEGGPRSRVSAKRSLLVYSCRKNR